MVKWVELQKKMKVLRGKRLTKNLLDDKASYPVFHGGIEPLGRYGEYNREANTVMVINVGASAGTVGFCDSRFWSSDGCFCISHSDDVSSKFLYYFMLGKTHYLQSQVRYAGIPTLDNSVIERIQIPILSLSEQNRIVGILDTFTESIENLKEQIAQRRKQYEYYRDQLLDLEGKEGVEMKTLGESSIKISSGKNNSKNTNGQYPVFGSTGIIAYCDDYLYDKPLILVARVGANAGYVHLSYGKYDVTDNTLIIDLKQNVNQKYIYYCLVKEKINRYAKGGGQPLITSTILKKLIIAIPSLKEQSRIVSILDTFEASIANLEAQLSQREKQYEYYRNKLLTFE